jgi:mannan endo-1,4-beta-mannosidase
MKNLTNILSPLLCLFLIACSKTDDNPPATNAPFAIVGSKLQRNGSNTQLIGANSFHSFSAGSRDMNAWNMDIAREFIGNVKEQPITGFPIRSATGAFLHSLQAVVDSNRLNNRITIICAFGWDGYDSTAFTGRFPSRTRWYAEFKQKLTAWATQFANQPDVWLEVWNEPYRFDRMDGYTDQSWLADMNDLVAVVRNAGNNNILLVPCAEQGQDESVLNNVGANFLSGKKNILFDVHAYEKWLDVPVASMEARLTRLQQNNLPVIIGEVAPKNAGILMNPQAFLESAYNKGFSICAWVWKYDGNDIDALLTSSGQANNNNNNNWGSLFQGLAARPRRP